MECSFAEKGKILKLKKEKGFYEAPFWNDDKGF